MILRKNNNSFLVEELQEVKNKIENLRRIPVSSRGQNIQIINQINSLLKKNNELLIVRQKSLENRNKVIKVKIERLVSRFM